MDLGNNYGHGRPAAHCKTNLLEGSKKEHHTKNNIASDPESHTIEGSSRIVGVL